MAAITQLRTVSPFTGRRYGSFVKTLRVPDFMHGSLTAFPVLVGDIRIVSTLSGDIITKLAIVGKIEINK